MKKSLFFSSMIVLLTVIPTLAGIGQSRFYAGGHLTLGLPQNTFKENVEDNGFGLTGYFGYRLPGSPFIIGGTGGFLIYGSETREEPFSTTIPDVMVDVTTTNSIILGHLLFRVQPPAGKVLPYAEGLLGFTYLTTDTRIEDQGDNEEIATSKNFDDITFSYGIGGGLMIPVYRPSREKAEKDGLFGVFIDINIRYLRGGEAEYLKEGSIRRSGGVVTFDITESRTDLVTVHLGVSFAF
jgi:hypothetical protein